MLAHIENALVSRLQNAESFLGYRLNVLCATPFDKPSQDLSMPAVLVRFIGLETIDSAQRGQSYCRARFCLTGYARNLRNEKQTRHGNPEKNQIGAWQIILDATALLAGQNLGLDMSEFVLDSIRPVETELYAAAGCVAEFSCHFGIAHALEDSAPFNTLIINWQPPLLSGADTLSLKGDRVHD